MDVVCCSGSLQLALGWVILEVWSTSAQVLEGESDEAAPLPVSLTLPGALIQTASGK